MFPFHSRRPRRGAVAAITLSAAALTSLTIGAGTAAAVVGGEPVDITSVPWQVSLQDPSGGHFCGGSILSPTLILTAAHCTVDTPASGIVVRAGATSLSSSTAQTVAVANIFENPAYLQGYATDVSVLVLSQPLVLGAGVAPIALASPGDLAGATTATTTGWGTTSETASDTPDGLLIATVPIVDDATCENALGGDVTASTETCAGGTGTDSCYGDSGGPLVVVDAAGVPKLAGVVSWGVECGGAVPGVYAEVPALADWITSITPDTPPVDRSDVSADCGIIDPDTGELVDDGSCDGSFDDGWYDDGWYDDPIGIDDGSGDTVWCDDLDGDGWCDEGSDDTYDDGGYDDGGYDDSGDWCDDVDGDGWCDDDSYGDSYGDDDSSYDDSGDWCDDVDGDGWCDDDSYGDSYGDDDSSYDDSGDWCDDLDGDGWCDDDSYDDSYGDDSYGDDSWGDSGDEWCDDVDGDGWCDDEDAAA